MTTTPVPLTSFVGREAELTALAAALAGARLVTVAGPGGCGKTRLAIEVLNRQPEPAVWVDLAAASDPVAEVARVTGVALAANEPAQLTRRLAGREMLLCLDNCEHVLGAVADLAVELLATCPGVVLLATSREPVRIAGEVVWRVPSLAGADAVALFEARAGEQAGAAHEAVRTACARLDGIPLAIELAAGWAATLSAQDILRGLDDRFALLIRGPRGVPARHQTLAASMAWSHDLLDDADRVLFRRLGVFAAGWTLATAHAVCGVDGLDVLSGLGRLVDKSLVVADTRAATTRYRMLETVHEYAGVRLAAAGETELLRDRHLDAFLALAEDAEPLLEQDKDAWLERIRAEEDELRAALEMGLSAEDRARGRRLAAALAWLWHLNGRGDEGIAFLRRAIEGGDRDEVQARLLTGLALVADTTRPAGLEYDAAQAALEIAKDPGTTGLALLLSGIGMFFADLDGAWKLAEQATQTQSGFVTDGATALMGIVRHLQDRHDEAVPLLKEAVAGLRARNDRGVGSTALAFVASSELSTGNVPAAREFALDAVRMAAPLGDFHRIGVARSVLAEVELAAGRIEEADAALAPMLRLVESADTPPFVPGLALATGHLRIAQGRADEALTWLTRESGLLGDLAPQTLIGLATVRRLAGDVTGAAEVCDRALEVGRRLGMPKVTADALEQSAFLTGDEDVHHEALAIRAEHGLWPGCLSSLEELGDPRLRAACARARQEMGLPSVAVEPTGDHVLDLREAVEYARRMRGKRRRPSSGWASLTPAEQSVVRLAAQGLTNPEIGSRLFMSRSTVKTHLSHVYAKLGVTNRTKLAAVARKSREENA